MKILIVAHGVDENEKRHAFDFLNSIIGGASILFGDGTDHLVNLDKVCEVLARVDGLILIQCSASPISNGVEESELQRIERLAVIEAIETKRKVGVIGSLQTLMSKHLNRCADGIGVIGIFKSPRDSSGAIADHFKAKPIYMGDMDRGARAFMRAFLPAPTKKVTEDAA